MREVQVGEGQSLELRREPDGLRYYLDAVGIHAGEMLDMVLSDGTHQLVRYEWSCEEGTLPTLWTAGEGGFPLPEGARFRWPQRRR